MMNLSDIDTLGRDLRRPECVLCTANGRTYVTNLRGGITIIEPDGSQADVLASNPGIDLAPNGFCLMADGSVLLANLAAHQGGVFRLTENGDLRPFLTEIDGMALPPTNYVHLDEMGRIWITVSTCKVPRALGYRKDVADGFIVLVDQHGARKVADNLAYANECIVHPDGKRLFVNETFGRRLSSYDISKSGMLRNKTTIAEFGPGTYPDGLTFDREGNIWITSVVSNRVIRLSADGDTQTVEIEDNDPDQVNRIEEAFQAGELTRTHLTTNTSKKLKNISSLAFGGRGLSRMYLGCLLGGRIYTCKAPISGHPPPHWNFAGPTICPSNYQQKKVSP